MRKDLIIGACHNYTIDQVTCWINSIKKTNFDGDIVLITFDNKEGIIQHAEAMGVIVVEKPFEPTLAIHVQRFAAIYDYIHNNNYGLVVTTDVRDVIFQSDPMDWLCNNLNTNKMIFATECLRYKDEPWGNQNLHETYGPFIHERFKNNEIFNVGIIAGWADYVKDLCLDIALNCINRPIKICDQAVFNVHIRNKVYSNQSLFSSLEDGWAANLGTLADMTKMDYFRPNLIEGEPEFDGQHVVYNSKQFVIVHQYDRTPWKNEIERIYS